MCEKGRKKIEDMLRKIKTQIAILQDLNEIFKEKEGGREGGREREREEEEGKAEREREREMRKQNKKNETNAYVSC